MIVRIQFHLSNLTKAVQKNCVQEIIANMILKMAGIGPLWRAGEYVFDGRLKATIAEDNTNKSEYYDMYANLRKVGSEETPSKLTEILEGDIGFQGRTSTPEIKYQILNGTLEVDEISPVLTLQGAK